MFEAKILMSSPTLKFFNFYPSTSPTNSVNPYICCMEIQEFKIGKNIRTIREIKGYSQDYMAEKLNISQKTYSNIEADKSKINTEIIKSISEILGIDPVRLLSFDEKILFNNCNNSGNLNTYHQALDRENKALKDSITQLREEVKFLREEVVFLRGILAQKN